MLNKIEQLENLVKPLVQESDFELFSLKAVMYRGTVNIEVLIDRPTGGISLDECAKMNKAIRKQVEEDNLYGDDYTVSVSSPGLDWPLKEYRDFRRLMGQKFDVQHHIKNDDAVLHHEGCLRSVDEQAILLETSEGEVSILLECIQKAVLMI